MNLYVFIYILLFWYFTSFFSLFLLLIYHMFLQFYTFEWNASGSLSLFIVYWEFREKVFCFRIGTLLAPCRPSTCHFLSPYWVIYRTVHGRWIPLHIQNPKAVLCSVDSNTALKRTREKEQTNLKRLKKKKERLCCFALTYLLALHLVTDTSLFTIKGRQSFTQ